MGKWCQQKPIFGISRTIRTSTPPTPDAFSPSRFAIVATSVSFWFYCLAPPTILPGLNLLDCCDGQRQTRVHSQVRVRVLNVDGEARKLVLSMRQKPRASSTEQGNVQKYADMLAEVTKGR